MKVIKPVKQYTFTDIEYSSKQESASSSQRKLFAGEREFHRGIPLSPKIGPITPIKRLFFRLNGMSSGGRRNGAQRRFVKHDEQHAVVEVKLRSRVWKEFAKSH